MMSDSDSKEDQSTTYIEYSGIRLSQHTIQTVKKNHITFTLQRAEINHLELHRGFTAERPLIQMLFGLALLLFCFFPIRTIAVWIFYGGTLYDVILILLLLLPLGLWLFVEALHRGLFIRAYLNSHKEHKLAFRGNPPKEELQKFASEASSRYGCIIQGL